MQVAPPAALEKLAFLAGHWRGEGDGFVLEEVWLAPAGGVAQGSVRMVRGNEIGTIELIVVAAERDRIVMRYNHFHPNYQTWEADGPITLMLMDVTDHSATFTNLAVEPRDAAEMGYRRSGDDLASWVVTIAEDGARQRHEFRFARVRS